MGPPGVRVLCTIVPLRTDSGDPRVGDTGHQAETSGGVVTNRTIMHRGGTAVPGATRRTSRSRRLAAPMLATLVVVASTLVVGTLGPAPAGAVAAPGALQFSSASFTGSE